MAKITILLILFISLIAVSVYADYNVWNEGNTGYGLTPYFFSGYSLNYPNPIPNITSASYLQCDIHSSSFNPVVFDVDGDSFGEIITGVSNSLYIYDRFCNLKQTLTLPENLNLGSPGIGNADQDANTDLYIGADKGIYWYEWDSTLSMFTLTYNISSPSASSINQISCPSFLVDKCLGFSGGTVYLYNLTSLTVMNASVFNFGTGSFPGDARREGVSFYQSGSVVKIPFCSVGFLTTLTCNIFNEYGQNYGLEDIKELNGTGVSINSMSAFYAKLGSILRFFVSYQYSDPDLSPVDYYSGGVVTDTVNFNVLFNTTSYNQIGDGGVHFSTKLVSNWAVADFNKDGENEACIMYASIVNYTGYAETYLRCIDGEFTELINTNVTGIMSLNNIVIADFNYGDSNMCFGTFEGIFCWNETSSTIYNYYSTGYSGNSVGYPVVYSDGSEGSPIMTFTDNTYGFNLKLDVIVLNCGNDICEDYENAFSCPGDCPFNTSTTGNNLPTGTASINGSLCASGYIEYGKCALKPFNMECDADSECLSNSCVNGICDDADYWEKIDASKTQLFGDSDATNNFISLVLILGVGIFIAMQGGIGIALGWVVIGVVFFTMVGWLSAFFLVGMILLGLIILVLGVVIKGNG